MKKEDLQKFLKRLRYNVSPRKFRYFAVGEYGSKSYRPHYHLLLFNLSLSHKKEIAKAWEEDGEPIGYIYIGDVTEASAKYCAKYTVKRLTTIGKDFYEKYPWLKGKELEFMTSSRGRKPDGGIGLGAVQVIANKLKKDTRFKKRVIREVKVGKKKMALGRYLTKKLSEFMEIPEEIKENDLYEYQEKIFTLGESGDGVHIQNIVDAGAQRRLRQSKRYKIWNNRGCV